MIPYQKNLSPPMCPLAPPRPQGSHPTACQAQILPDLCEGGVKGTVFTSTCCKLFNQDRHPEVAHRKAIFLGPETTISLRYLLSKIRYQDLGDRTDETGILRNGSAVSYGRRDPRDPRMGRVTINLFPILRKINGTNDLSRWELVCPSGQEPPFLLRFPTMLDKRNPGFLGGHDVDQAFPVYHLETSYHARCLMHDV